MIYLSALQVGAANLWDVVSDISFAAVQKSDNIFNLVVDKNVMIDLYGDKLMAVTHCLPELFPKERLIILIGFAGG